MGKLKVKTKKVLKKVFMVGVSDCPFGETVVQEASFFSSLDVKSEQLLTFVGDAQFDTEIEAIKHIEKLDVPACIIQEVFVWEVK